MSRTLGTNNFLNHFSRPVRPGTGGQDIENRAEAPAAAASRQASTAGTEASATGVQAQAGILGKMKRIWHNHKSLRVATTLAGLYVGHMACRTIETAAQAPADVRENPRTWFRDGVLKFAPRADMMEVQRARQTLVDTFSGEINLEYCQYPSIEFRSRIENGAVAYYYPPTESQPATISLRTYLPNLALTAAHEYLHCFSSDAFWTRAKEALGDFRAQAAAEGIIELLARALPLPHPDPAEFNTIYPKEVNIAKAIVRDIGEDTARRALLSGEDAAISQFIASARKHLPA